MFLPTVEAPRSFVSVLVEVFFVEIRLEHVAFGICYHRSTTSLRLRGSLSGMSFLLFRELTPIEASGMCVGYAVGPQSPILEHA